MSDRHAEQNERVKALLARIDADRRAFNRETLSRRRLLQSIHEDIEAHIEPPDPLTADIQRQWQRLYAYNAEVRLRYQRRFKRPPPRTVRPVPADPDDWRAYHWQLDASNHPISNVHNAAAALRESPALSGLVALDKGQRAVVLKGPLPFAFWEALDFEMRRMKDEDLSGLLEYLQAIGLATLTREDCLAAVRLIARENAWWPADG